MSHTNGIELCVIFVRRPEIHVIGIVRSREDAQIFVQQKLATIRSRLELVLDSDPKIQRLIEAEWMIVTVPSEPQLVFPEGEPK